MYAVPVRGTVLLPRQPPLRLSPQRIDMDDTRDAFARQGPPRRTGIDA